MATKQQVYAREQQRAILAEADAAVRKAVDGLMKKYPGILLPYQLGIQVMSEPLTVSHSTTTRPLTAADKAAVSALTPAE